MSHLALLGILALVLACVGVVGVVVPVLPGSLLVAAGLLVWALAAHSVLGWITLAIGCLVVAAGSITGTVFTRRRLVQRSVPQWIIVVATGGGLVGAFALPGPGLLIGFISTLLAIELVRVRDLRTAVATTCTAMRALGVGLMVELGCDLLATSGLTVSVWVSVHSG